MNEYVKTYYTNYCVNEDKTFIMCDFFENDCLLTTEVVGFHFGKPNENSFDFIGSTKAQFDW